MKTIQEIEQDGPTYCNRCGERLNPGRIKWLEYWAYNDEWVDPKKIIIPTDQSQGLFPFGSNCAKVVEAVLETR